VPELPTRGVVRAARLAGVPAAFAGRRVVGLGRRIGGRPAELITAEVQARTAAQLFSVLGELKGGAMKAGQWLSAMESALPEQLAGPYADALTKLQDAAPAMPKSVVHRVLVEELGEDWRGRFREFDDEPSAAASIGQVHRAAWRDGRPVAVKVQYPGAGDALATDLRQLDRLVPLLRPIVPHLDARSLFAELRAKVMSEVDYRQEAEAQRAFADAYRDDPDFVVPGVVEVADRVLVSEWVDGTPLAAVLRGGKQGERDRVGLLLARFLLGSPERVARLHGDPHPGNFRVQSDGRLAVVDFGSSLPMRGGWPKGLVALLRAGRDADADALLSVVVSAGLVAEGTLEPAALLEMVGPLLEPLRQETFTFSRTWMRSQTTRFSDPRSPTARVQRKLAIPPRFLLVQRVAAGTTGVLCSLGATVPLRAEAERWLPGLRGTRGK
jgi:predicted unusual protein kinase regulating ubiquinone biosynthesis (AarF/ABC1/UbiB family)